VKYRQRINGEKDMNRPLFANFIYLLVIAAMLAFDITGLLNMTLYRDALKSDRLVIGVMFGVLFISCLYFRWNRKNDRFSNSYFLLIGYIYIISIINSLFSPIDKIDYLTMAMPLMMFMSSRASTLKVNFRFQRLCLIFGFVLLFYYYYSSKTLVTQTNVMDYYHNNSSYYLLYLLPLLLCNPKDIVKWGSIFIVAIVVFTSTKRGGSIAFLFSILIYLYTRYFIQGDKRNRLIDRLAVFVLIVFAGFIVYSFLESSIDVLMDRIGDNNDQGERGRMTIYQTVLAMISSSAPEKMLFGHGWNQVIVDNPIGLSAHNDFLECIYDFGFIGFLLLIYFFYQLIRYSIRLVKTHSSYGPPMAVASAILFVNSMVSHILIYPAFAITFALFFGYVTGMESINKTK